jgi:hypothetical protein
LAGLSSPDPTLIISLWILSRWSDTMSLRYLGMSWGGSESEFRSKGFSDFYDSYIGLIIDFIYTHH